MIRISKEKKLLFASKPSVNTIIRVNAILIKCFFLEEIWISQNKFVDVVSNKLFTRAKKKIDFYLFKNEFFNPCFPKISVPLATGTEIYYRQFLKLKNFKDLNDF